MDATSFIVLAAVAAVMSFNLTASMMCCRSLSRRVDRLEDRLDSRIDRVEQRMDRMEQVLMQLVADMALARADMALVKAQLGIATPAPQPAVVPPSGAAAGAAAQ